MMLYESYYGVADLGDDQLEHHGIKGQKWGVRRYQYEDGLLTPAGRARYDVGPAELKSKRKIAKRLNAADNMISDAKYVERRASRKIAKYEKKLSKLEGKDSGRAQRKAEKLNNKLSAEKQTRKSAVKTQKDVSKVRDEVIERVKKAGFDIKAKNVYKDAESAKRYIATNFGGILGTALYNRSAYVEGKKYKVSKAKNGQKGTYKDAGNKISKHRAVAGSFVKAAALNSAANVAAGTAISGAAYLRKIRRGLGNTNYSYWSWGN